LKRPQASTNVIEIIFNFLTMTCILILEAIKCDIRQLAELLLQWSQASTNAIKTIFNFLTMTCTLILEIKQLSMT